MTVKELHDELERIMVVHPEAQTVEARNPLGYLAKPIVRITKKHVVIIEGIKSE